ncbi:hypothetical protein GE061_020098 [Apolygus lucorum]|uniref:acid phosphatase n=1 Tax=Apolygus lucorum TaxID=248454 RepID=A0A6A4JI06_APOLU|nr:hypothetical protein GE061_020098 [Apolygus lucorum]
MEWLRVPFILGMFLVSCLSDDIGGFDLEGIAQDFLDLPEEKAAGVLSKFNKNEGKVSLATLRYVLVVTRHGSRSPTYTYPTDPYPFTDLKFWPNGPGQLTRLGKQQLFRTGLILRHRYNGFLNANYYSNDTEVRSNPYDRDYMSAACLLAALYPPVGFQVWNKKIAWQPIPIWEDRYDIAEIASKEALCPKFYELQTKNLDRLNQESSKYTNLFKYLSKNTKDKINTISRIPLIWDTLQAQQENGYKLPEWTKKVFPDRMRGLEGVAFQAYVYGPDPEQIKLVVGPLLEMILDQLNTKASGKMQPDRKLYINAAHDITLRALLDGMGLHRTFPIDTSAFMVYELHENSAGHIVRTLYYSNSSTHQPQILNLPLCHNPCSLKTFTSVLQKNVPRNWREECQNTTSDESR